MNLRTKISLHDAKFGCCFSYCVRACRGSQNFGASPPWNWVVTDPPERRISLVCYHAKCGHSLSNYTSEINDDHQKKNCPVPISRSFEVIGTDMDRSDTYDFLLVNRSNHGPVS